MVSLLLVAKKVKRENRYWGYDRDVSSNNEENSMRTSKNFFDLALLKVVHNRFRPKNCLDFLSHQSYNQEHGEKNRKRSITTKPGT
jgi:hypothetical protein